MKKLLLFLSLFLVASAFVGCDDTEEGPSVNQGFGNNPDDSTDNPSPVDLGLSVKWASCNVGANSPEEYGDYFAWGETSEKAHYIKESSKTYDKSIGNIAGDPTYDAARANWGGSWRMPTQTELEELKNSCTWIWTTQGGHNGYKVTGPNGNSIFLPAAGFRYSATLSYAGELGCYWSATPVEGDSKKAHDLRFDEIGYSLGWYDRHYGRTVRAVLD